MSTFVTPEFMREIVAEATDRKSYGIMVRIWTASIFYGALGAAAGFCVGYFI